MGQDYYWPRFDVVNRDAEGNIFPYIPDVDELVLREVGGSDFGSLPPTGYNVIEGGSYNSKNPILYEVYSPSAGPGTIQFAGQITPLLAHEQNKEVTLILNDELLLTRQPTELEVHMRDNTNDIDFIKVVSAPVFDDATPITVKFDHPVIAPKDVEFTIISRDKSTGKQNYYDFTKNFALRPPPLGAELAPPGAGTVTSITVTVPSILSVTPSTITTSGTFAVTLATQTANKALMSGVSGSAAVPTFRAIVALDLGTGANGSKYLRDTMAWDYPMKIGDLVSGSTNGYVFYSSSGNLAQNSSFKYLNSRLYAPDLTISKLTTFGVSRTLPTTVGNAIEIGTFLCTTGCALFDIAITTVETSASTMQISRKYEVPIDATGMTSGTWYKVNYTSNRSVFFFTQDYDLEVKYESSTTMIHFRLRRILGTAGATAYLSILQSNFDVDNFTASTSTSSPSAPTFELQVQLAAFYTLKLRVNRLPGTPNNYDASVNNWNSSGYSIPATIMTATNNGGSTPSSAEPALVLVRDGVQVKGGGVVPNWIEFKIKRWENNSTNSRSALVIAAVHANTAVGVDIVEFRSDTTAHFVGAVYIPMEAYGTAWISNLTAPTKGDLYDKIKTIDFSSSHTYTTDDDLGSFVVNIINSSLPTSFEIQGLLPIIVIKNIGLGTATITNSAGNIEGSSSLVLATNQSAILISSSTAMWKVN